MNRSANGFFSFIRIDSGFLLRCFLLGLPPLLLIFYCLLGSLQSLVQVLLLSVVCTLGIGGFFWFGLAVLTGFVLQLLVPPLRGAATALPPAAAAQSPDPLVAFIRARRAQGGGEEALRRDLRRAGWSQEQVAAALEQAGGAMAVAPAGAEEGDGR